MRDPATGKDFELQLHIDRSVKPVQTRPRNKPFHLLEQIDKLIQKKLEGGQIEEVTGEPTEWLSETVIVPKGDTGEIRMCTDMKEANRAILREPHEMPNLETLLYNANGMKFGAKLDLNSAFESWDESKQQMVDTIKNGMIKSIGYFDTKWNTVLTADASPVGLSGILTQENPKDPNDIKVITHVSRKLSETETRYSQIEKEALACVWACERLQLYLLGNKFVLFTDNRAVFLILKNPLSKPPARILRWELRLRGFDFTVKHRPGIGNISDFLSRHPMDLTAENKVENEACINAIVQYSMPTRVSKTELLSELKQDKVMVKLTEMIKNSKFDKTDKDVQPFNRVFDELTVTSEGLILRQENLVIPASFTARVVDLAHQAHLGIVRIKRLIRSKVWFPGIDAMVESKVKTCMGCQAVERTGASPAPLQMSKLPRAPWIELSLDCFGPIAPTGEYLLVLVDDYSRFVIVEVITATSAEVVTRKLEYVFSLFGNPECS
jgi:hypothetical protein